jgi:hypothetical protein
MLPLELNDVNVPTLVMLGCAFVVTVPAVVADPADVAYVALATVPVTLAPAKLVNVDPLPMKYPPEILPVVTIVFDPNPANNVTTLALP